MRRSRLPGALAPFFKVRNRLEKSTPPISRPMGGMMTSSTSDLTMPEKAVPTTIPTAEVDDVAAHDEIFEFLFD